MGKGKNNTKAILQIYTKQIVNHSERTSSGIGWEANALLEDVKKKPGTPSKNSVKHIDRKIYTTTHTLAQYALRQAETWET